MKPVRCELCNAEIPREKCMFAVYEKVVDGEKYYFCCKGHAEEFTRKTGKGKKK